MPRKNLQNYRAALMEMRRRVSGEMDHVSEAIRQESNPTGNLSSAPIHMADIASEGIFADVRVLENEQDLLNDIDAALERLAAGMFGQCENCGREIAPERLDAIPYTPYCVECAQDAAQNGGF